MFTAVQLREDAGLCCRILHGKPREIVPGRLGQIALFEPGQRVLYLVQEGRRQQAYWFQTNPENGGQRIAGVQPGADLLLTAATTGRVAKLRNVLVYLKKAGVGVDQLDDGFFVRLSVLLEGQTLTLGQVKRIISHAKL